MAISLQLNDLRSLTAYGLLFMTMEERDELRLFLFGHGEEECSQEHSDGGGDAGDDHS